MATLDKDIIDAIIARNGAPQEGDPFGVKRVVTYNNMFNGALEYAAIYDPEDLLRYHNSPACHNVKVIWDRDETKPEREPGPYAVYCGAHNLVYLTREEYLAQMSAADSPWRCPICGLRASFDDDTYEDYMDAHRPMGAG